MRLLTDRFFWTFLGSVVLLGVIYVPVILWLDSLRCRCVDKQNDRH